MQELAIFVVFVAIQYTAKALPGWMAEGRAHALVVKLSENHFVVWLAHPALVQGLHEYVVHFVVYSGYVIRAH